MLKINDPDGVWAGLKPKAAVEYPSPKSYELWVSASIALSSEFYEFVKVSWHETGLDAMVIWHNMSENKKSESLTKDEYLNMYESGELAALLANMNT
jgi:hypothetical protein